MRKLVHQMMMFTLLLSLCRSSIAAPQMAKAGCNESCGNITIPYPFGIGRDGHNENCYLDEWFQVDCNKTTKWRPYLRRTKQEVLNISIESETRFGSAELGTGSMLQVYSPVTFFCNENNSRQAANLTDSPFKYSQFDNILTAVSCGKSVLVSSTNFSVSGCISTCDPDNITHPMRSCDAGINCCQTSMPSDIRVIKYVNASTYVNETGDCNKFAFLADSDWLKKNNILLSDLNKFKSMHKEVAVTLDWSLFNDTKTFAALIPPSASLIIITYFEDDSNRTRYRFDDRRYCEVIRYRTLNSSDFYCSCYSGFEGNPYLGPCYDINECMDEETCSHWYYKGKCVNTPGSYDCHHGNKAKLIVAAGLSSSFGLLLLLTGLWFGYKLLKKRNEIKQRKKFYKRNGGLLLEQQLSSGKVDVEKIKLFKSRELEKSTDSFNRDRILGQGGQGTVYKGMLEDGRIIAVKKSKMVDESQISEFINEVVILSQINHRNVVQLLGCCLETEVPLLVYEYIPNGTLSKYIIGQIEDFPLTWKMRLRIATEVAGALGHLHYTASVPIYHRDIKSTNILLDEKYRAKVADFGTSRSIAIDQTHLTTSLVHGTFGYLDPEYFQSSQFTEKSDVYSFGVVLVELLTGQKPISFLRSEEEGRSLATYFIISMHKDRLFEIVDAQVLKEGSKADIQVVANLARRCLNLSGRERPTMREVTAELDGIQKLDKSSTSGPTNYELVEFVRHESVEPWDSSTEPILDACEIPLVLSFMTR